MATTTSTRTPVVETVTGDITLTLTPASGRRWDGQLAWGPSTLGRVRGVTAVEARAWAKRTAKAWQTDLRRVPEEVLLAAFTAEVDRRGGQTLIGDGVKNREYSLRLTEVTAHAVRLHARGWYRISSRVGDVSRTIDYLAGIDDNGLWARRVPFGYSVEESFAYIEPAEVKRRPHLRQGDVYLVRMERGTGTESGVIADSHLWDAETRTLVHQARDGELPHATVVAPAAWPAVKVVQQRQQAIWHNILED